MLDVTNQVCVLRQALDVVEMAEIMQNFENSFRLLFPKQGVDALIDGSVDEMRDAGVAIKLHKSPHSVRNREQCFQLAFVRAVVKVVNHAKKIVTLRRIFED